MASRVSAPGTPPPGDELTLAGLATLGAGTVCDEEPIHLSGAIQPHGFLLGVDPRTSTVRVASANIGDHLATDPARALGAPLAEVLGPGAADRVAVLLPPTSWWRADPLPLELPSVSRGHVRFAGRVASGGHVASGGPVLFEVVAHPSGPLVLLEFERVPGTDAGSTTFHDAVRHALDPVHTSSRMETVCTAAAAQVRSVSGFDRVLVYQFDDDGHGFVVAESVAPGSLAQSLLGMHYPPGDIPRQARSLMLRKRVRMIADVDYVPVDLLGQSSGPGAGDLGGVGELDLTLSDLRSVSPLHLKYLRGMGVAATLSISLVSEDRLWGMVLCHHHSPRQVSHRVRAVCDTLARTLTLQLDVARFRLGRERAAGEARLTQEAVTRLGEPESLADAVAKAAAALTGVVGADAVLLRVDGEIAAPGGLVPADEVPQLVARASAHLAAAGTGLWSTDSADDLAAAPGVVGDPPVPGPRPEPGPVAGVLALPLVGIADGLIVWVRREHVEVISWAGAKPEDPRADRDFFPRQEIVRGHSRPWSAGQLEAARTLGHALPEALLRRTRRLLEDRDAGSRAERVASQQTRVRLERDLQRKLRLESLGKLAGGVAHDFNNLLSVILSHAEFVEDEVRAAAHGPDGERWQAVARDTEQITSATQRAAQLTRELLTFARREVTQPRALEVNQVLSELEMLLRRTLGHQVDLRLALTDEPTTVLADPEQLERVLVNLAVNARDAMPGGGTLTVTTDVLVIADGDVADGLATAAGRHVRVRVDDTGTGIPRELLERVFDPFFTTKGDGEGSGLGLATVHGIVDQAGGKVQIYSEPGNGTSVTVLLPATDAAAVIPPAPPVAPMVHGRTVLLVEDEPAIRDATRRVLEHNGYEVLAAGDGVAAVQAADEFAGTIDVLLTDVALPGMLGREVAARITGGRPEVRVVFMSGFALPGAADSRLEPGATLLDKPFTRVQLLTALAERPDRPAGHLTDQQGT